MGLCKYSAFAKIEGIEYYRISVVADIVSRGNQTVTLWDKWSDQREKDGLPRLIPACVRIGSNRIRCWNEKEIQQILVFSKSIKYGDIAEYTRTVRGTAGKNISQDRSTVARKEKMDTRKKINQTSKKITKKLAKENETQAKRDMLKRLKQQARLITKIK